MKASNKEARRWFLQSVDDYQFVKWVLREGVFFDKGCFISQQAGEKALKACLYALGKRRIIGHSLYEMADEISKHDHIDYFYVDDELRYTKALTGLTEQGRYKWYDVEEEIKGISLYVRVVAGSGSTAQNRVFRSLEVE